MFFTNKTRHRDPETMAAFRGASGEFKERNHSPSVPSYYASTTFSERVSSPRLIEGLLSRRVQSLCPLFLRLERSTGQGDGRFEEHRLWRAQRPTRAQVKREKVGTTSKSEEAQDPRKDLALA
jgi:hypothetical protein